MSDGKDKGSVAMFGSPGFAVWCCVRWVSAGEKLKDDFTGELWINVAMPAILPAGSSVDLPTPREWGRVTGVMTGTIASWALMGSAIVCEIRDESHLGIDSVQELLAIGYANHDGGYPDEVWSASEGLLR